VRLTSTSLLLVCSVRTAAPSLDKFEVRKEPKVEGRRSGFGFGVVFGGVIDAEDVAVTVTVTAGGACACEICVCVVLGHPHNSRAPNTIRPQISVNILMPTDRIASVEDWSCAERSE